MIPFTIAPDITGPPTTGGEGVVDKATVDMLLAEMQKLRERSESLQAQVDELKKHKDEPIEQEPDPAEPEPTTPDPEPKPKPKPEPEPEPEEPEPKPRPKPEPEPEPDDEDEDEEDEPRKRYVPPPDPIVHPGASDPSLTQEEELRRRYERPALPKGQRYDKQRKKLKGRVPMTFEELQARQQEQERIKAMYGDYPPQNKLQGGHSRMISFVGPGYGPHPHYPKPKPRFAIPPTDGAPFSVEDDTIDSPFGVGSASVPPRGFQQERRNRRGAIRDRASQSPTAGIMPESILDRVKNIENKQNDHLKTIKDIRGKYSQIMSMTAGTVSNPQGMIGDQVLQLLGGMGPKGAAIVAAITAIVAAPKTVEMIIKVLAQKGLPLNADWHRLIEEEVNGLFDIEEKKRRLLGIDGFVVSQSDRYQPDSGATVHNSFENRHEIIISKSIGLADKAVGIR